MDRSNKLCKLPINLSKLIIEFLECDESIKLLQLHSRFQKILGLNFKSLQIIKFIRKEKIEHFILHDLTRLRILKLK